jgi:hypothetical protein
MSKYPLRLAIALSAVLSCTLAGAACARRVSERVTCDGLRSLKIGDPPELVAAAIGEPVRRVSPDPGFENAHDWDSAWSYESRGFLQDNGIILSADFKAKHLIRLNATLRSVLGKQENLFSLSSEGRFEGPKFSTYFQCSNK